MVFNQDLNKQATEVYFTNRINLTNVPLLIFNDNVVNGVDTHKHLGLILDNKLTFQNHVNENNSKANKGIDIIFILFSQELRFYVFINHLSDRI